MFKKIFYSMSLALLVLVQSCNQNSANYIGVKKNPSNKPSPQGDGKRPSEEGEGLVGYLRSPDAVRTSTNGVQREIFGDPGAILTDVGSPKDLDICALGYGDNFESAAFLPQDQFLLATTKASRDGSFRLSIPESVALSARLIALDVSGRCRSKDFRPSSSTKASFVVSSADLDWSFQKPPTLQNALAAKKESVQGDDTPVPSLSGTPSMSKKGTLAITSGHEFICELMDDPRCPMYFYIGIDAWQRRDLSVYPLGKNQTFRAVLYRADTCDASVVNLVYLDPGAPTALTNYPCVVPMGASFEFIDSTYVSFVPGNYLLTVQGDDRWSAVFLRPKDMGNLSFIENSPVKTP